MKLKIKNHLFGISTGIVACLISTIFFGSPPLVEPPALLQVLWGILHFPIFGVLIMINPPSYLENIFVFAGIFIFWLTIGSILRRMFRKDKREIILDYTFFYRENAPSCFEVSLFEDESELERFIQSLLQSEIRWHWLSRRGSEAIEEFREWDLPKHRYLTLLTEDNSQILFQDFLEKDLWNHRRSIKLFGIEREQTILSTIDLEIKLKDFLANENASLKCVINQICDMHEQYIFVPNDPDAEMQKLLSEWKLSKDYAQRITKYKRLNLAKLESMAEWIVKAAFPS